MRLSVIVPTHDRREVLRDCLETLQHQDADPADLEVVVVDDGSASDIASVVAAVGAAGPVTLRCERQALTGLNGARNRGVEIATGEILAFLDDDTLVNPGWATALLSAFADGTCGAAGGRIQLRLAGPEPAWMTEWRSYLAEYDLGPELRPLREEDPVPVGANCSVRRDVFVTAGGFRHGLDRVGASLVSNGDTEFFRRLRREGERLLYVPAARVVHRVPASRMTLEYFIARHRAQGVSDELLLRFEGHRASWGHRVGLGREVTRAAGDLVLDVIRRRDRSRDRLLLSYWSARVAATRLTVDAPAA